jgi:hypothetical protein
LCDKKNRRFIRETSVLVSFVAGSATERYAQSFQPTPTAMQTPASKIAPHIIPRSKSSFVGSTNLFGCTIDDSSRVDCPVFLSESMFGLFLLGTIYFAEMKRSWADRLTIVY